MKTMNKTVKGLLFGATVLGGTMMMSGSHEAHADTWVANSTQQIEQQMAQQTKQDGKLVVYVVQKGDTLSGISAASKISMKTIMDLNNIQNPNMLSVGQKINLGDSQKAREFVESKGQSIKENAKGYQAPKAKATVNSTKQNSKYTTSMKKANATVTPVSTNNGNSSEQQPSQGGNQGVTNEGSSNTTQQPSYTMNPDGTITPNHGSQNNQSGSVNNGGSQQGSATQTPSQPNQPSQGNNNGGSTTPEQPNQPSQGGNQGGSQTPSQPNQPSQGGNNGGQTTPSTPDKPSNGGNTGNNTPNQPSKPDQGGNQGGQTTPEQQVSAEEINKTYQNDISNKYGFKGQWMDSKDGYDQADYDMRTNGYAESATWKGDKNPNQTLGSISAQKTDETWKEYDKNFGDYQYGYSHTTTSKGPQGMNQSHTDYYFWN